METKKNTPLFLSHHYEDEYERCIAWKGYHFCRRCVFLYPLFFLCVGLSFRSWMWPVVLDPYFLWILPIPATIEFTLEQLRFIPYRPRIQIFTTLLLAPALGRGFARYFIDQTDLLFWDMIFFFGGICGSAWFYRKRYLQKIPENKDRTTDKFL